MKYIKALTMFLVILVANIGSIGMANVNSSTAKACPIPPINEDLIKELINPCR